MRRTWTAACELDIRRMDSASFLLKCLQIPHLFRIVSPEGREDVLETDFRKNVRIRELIPTPPER